MFSGTTQKLNIKVVDANTQERLTGASCTIRNDDGNVYSIHSNPGTVEVARNVVTTFELKPQITRVQQLVFALHCDWVLAAGPARARYTSGQQTIENGVTSPACILYEQIAP